MRLTFTLSNNTVNHSDVSMPVSNVCWEIPWVEGLPNKSGIYLVTDVHGVVGLASYYIDDDSGGLVKSKWERNIVAWSSLPEPYKK